MITWFSSKDKVLATLWSSFHEDIEEITVFFRFFVVVCFPIAVVAKPASSTLSKLQKFNLSCSTSCTRNTANDSNDVLGAGESSEPQPESVLSSSCVSGASSVTSCSASANSSGVSWQPPGLFNQTPTCCWFTYLKKKMLCVLCCVYYVACTMLCVLCCVYYVSYFPSVLACLWCLCAVSVCVSSSDSENEDNVPMRLTAQRQPATPAAKRPRLSSSSASKGGMLTWLLSLPLILSL